MIILLKEKQVLLTQNEHFFIVDLFFVYKFDLIIFSVVLNAKKAKVS